MGNYHYKAFISYSHKDHRWGGWLHRRLERYRLPKHLNTEGECMPPALRFQLGAGGQLTDQPAEPLAADLRTSGDGKRLGMLKIISGMLGVGLDELVQRDLQRNSNRVTAITATALGAVLAMGTLTGFALSARKETDARRVEAEGLVEYMLTELKPELEAVGRLKPLSIVSERAAKYYEDQPLSAHNDNALGRRTRVFHLIREIDDEYGAFHKAQERFEGAYVSTKALLAKYPENLDRTFDHAKSAYWAGITPYREENYAEVALFVHKYVKLAKRLEEVEPESLRSMHEMTCAYTHLGIAYFYQRKFTQVLAIFKKSSSSFNNSGPPPGPKKTSFRVEYISL